VSKLDKLFAKLDQNLDYDEYATLARRNPRLAETIAELIEAGATPHKIAVHITDGRPHRWPEAQAIFAAARYLESQDSNE
jgi:DNA-directed RNA polymerase subunit F